MGQQNYTLKEIKTKIIHELDIATMLQTLISNGEIDLKSIKNPHIIDEDGEIDLDIDLNKENYIEIVCPFHETDNPGSARLKRLDPTSVKDKGNFLKCFVGGCAAHKPLNPIDLYMVLKFNVDPKLLGTNDSSDEFIKAIAELASMIDIEFDYNSRTLTDEEKKELRIAKIREEAGMIYHNALKTNKYAHKAKDYLLKERGFMYSAVPFEELVERFKIGFAPGFFGTTWLYNQLRKKYTDEDLLESGVVFRYTDKKTGERKIIDMLTNGVVLPYFSKGKINNLYSRSINALNKNFRHLRLKGNVDVPIHWDGVIKEQNIIIVEGELSWLSMIALGFENTIGNRGTNGLSEEHIALLKSRRDKTDGETCRTIYLCFDPDDSGKDAVMTTGKRLIEKGFDVRVMRLGKGDPNDFLIEYKEKAKEKMQEIYDNAISYEAFMVLRKIEKYEIKTNADRTAVLKEVKEFRKEIEPDLLAPIALEVSELMPEIKVEWLLATWLGAEIPTIDFPKEEALVKKSKTINPGLDRALKFSWMVITDQKETIKALHKNSILQNIVYVNDVSNFISKIKNEKRSFNIVIDEAFSSEMKNKIISKLEQATFKTLISNDLNKLAKSTKDDFLQLIVDFDVANLKIS